MLFGAAAKNPLVGMNAEPKPGKTGTARQALAAAEKERISLARPGNNKGSGMAQPCTLCESPWGIRGQTFPYRTNKQDLHEPNLEPRWPGHRRGTGRTSTLASGCSLREFGALVRNEAALTGAATRRAAIGAVRCTAAREAA